jgi:hypothetical protein
MQRPHRVFIDLGGLLAASLEDVSRALQQSLLPLMDHRRMHAYSAASSDTVHSPFKASKRHAGLEPRVMVPALPHVLIYSFGETSRRQIIASVTVRFSGSSSFMRRTKVAQIYKKTGNLRVVQLLLGHTKMDSTVRYLGVDIEDALTISEGNDL